MIGIFDSGLGGLTVAKSILKKIPNAQILYFGDTARVPYGTKSKKAVLRYSFENTDFLIRNGAEAIVIACNTSSAIAASSIKRKINVSVFEVVGPAVKEAIKFTKKRKIGVIATPRTIRSRAYQKKVNRLSKNKIKIYSKKCPLLVPLIEEGLLEGRIIDLVLKRYLSFLKKKDIDVLILGCTHYPLIKKSISKIIGKNVKIIDSADTVAFEVVKSLENKKEKKFFLKVFLSDEGYSFNKISRKIFNKKVPYQIIN